MPPSGTNTVADSRWHCENHENLQLLSQQHLSHRLRIVLNLKALEWTDVAVDLRAEAHLSAHFMALNPQGLVPVLIDGDLVLTQSPTIIEWLEERYPTPALLPTNADDRARVRALAAVVGCDIHPLNNRRVLEYLRHTLGADEATNKPFNRTSRSTDLSNSLQPPSEPWISCPCGRLTMKMRCSQEGLAVRRVWPTHHYPPASPSHRVLPGHPLMR